MRNRLDSSSKNPLFTVFEKHLYYFNECSIDRTVFIGKVVDDYLKYLRFKKMTIPLSHEATFRVELEAQVRVMLIKTIYGAMTVKEHVERSKKGSSFQKKKKRIQRCYDALWDSSS